MSAPARPFVHFFVRRKLAYPFCVVCGTVRRGAGPQSGCRGSASVTIRAMNAVFKQRDFDLDYSDSPE